MNEYDFKFAPIQCRTANNRKCQARGSWLALSLRIAMIVAFGVACFSLFFAR